MSLRLKLSQQYYKELNIRRQPHLPYQQDQVIWNHLEALFVANANNPNLTRIQLQDINEDSFMTNEREQIHIIHEKYNKQNTMYNYNSTSSAEYITQNLNNLFIEVLNNNSNLLLTQTLHNHCLIYLYESNFAFHLVLIISYKKLQIDNIQYRSNYVVIQAWSRVQLQIVQAQVVWEDQSYNQLYTNTESYNNNDLIAYEIKIDNKDFQQPLIYIYNNAEKLPLLQIIIQQDNNKQVVSSTYLSEQQSILQNRIGCKTQDFLKYIFSTWAKKKMSLEKNPQQQTNQEKYFQFQFIQQSHKKKESNERPIFQNHLQLTPIPETFAENFASSIKAKKDINNYDEDLSGLLSKYGLATEQQKSNQTPQFEGQQNNLASVLSKYGLDGDINQSDQVAQFELRNPSNTVQSVCFFKTESSVDQINQSITQMKNNPQSFQIENQNQYIDFNSRVQSDTNINSKYEGYFSQTPFLNSQKQNHSSSIQSLPLYASQTNHLNQSQRIQNNINQVEQIPLQENQQQQFQVQNQSQFQDFLQQNNNTQPILEQQYIQIEQPQQYCIENQNFLVPQPIINYDQYYQQLLQWQAQNYYQQQFQMMMNNQYLFQQQTIQQQQIDPNTLERKKSSSILSPYSSRKKSTSTNQDLLYMSEKVEKRSVSEDVYYSNRKNSRSDKSFASSSQNSKIIENRVEFKSSLVRKLSIRQLKLQSQNKIMNSHLNKSKLCDLGIEILTNLSDNQPIIKLDEIIPQDFIDYSAHHSQKKVNEILKYFSKQNKIWRSVQRPFSQLYNDVKFADLTLLINGQKLRVHKSVMISFSPFFEKLLSNSRSISIIELQQVDQQTLPIVIKYIYLQQIQQAQWDEITLEMAQRILQTSLKFEIQNLCEEIVAKVQKQIFYESYKIIIPKMRKESCLEWFQLVCQILENENSLSYLFKYLYKYLLKFFAFNSQHIIILIRKHQLQLRELKIDSKLSGQLLEAKNYFSNVIDFFQFFKKIKIFKINSNNFTDLIINALQNVQPDAVENLLWILMVRLNLKDYISLLTTFSQQYEDVRSGFQYRNFKNEIPESQVLLVKQDCFSIIKTFKQKSRKRNSIFIQNKTTIEIVDEEILNQYQFKQEKLYSDTEAKLESIKFQPCDYEISIDITKMTKKNNNFIISQCFSSGTNCWRIIFDLDDNQNISLYLQERGSIKQNAQNLNFLGEDDTFIPEGTNQEFISIIFRIEVSTDNKQVIVSRSLFHSFPIKQLYTIGFQNLFYFNQIQKLLKCKVWIIESSVHSAAMTYISRNFGQILNTKPEQILRISNYDIYSLLQSDQLCVSEEDTLKKLFYTIYNQRDPKKTLDLELLIYPIRFTYLTPQVVLSLCRDINVLREDKLFQKYVSLLFHWNIEAENSNPLQPRIHYVNIKQEVPLTTNFYDSLLSWLFNSDHQQQQMKLNVDQMKNEIEKQKNSINNLQQFKITPVKQVLQNIEKSKVKVQMKYEKLIDHQEKPIVNSCTLL